MWATLQDQYFLIGTALVAISHAVKFGELNSTDPVTGRYITLLPGAKVRDFTGPYAYHIALAAFLGVSLTAYFFVCQISPEILRGAAGFFGGPKAQQAIEGVAYPLYVAALFVGLTQPIVPVFARRCAARLFSRSNRGSETRHRPCRAADDRDPSARRG